VIDRDQVRECLSGSGTSCDEIRLPALGNLQSLILVLVQTKRLTITAAEEPGRERVEYARLREIREHRARLVSGIKLKNRFRPEVTGVETLGDKIRNSIVSDPQKTLNVPAIVGYNLVTQSKNVH